jgi:octaprenyl-diphosphate synthase
VTFSCSHSPVARRATARRAAATIHSQVRNLHPWEGVALTIHKRPLYSALVEVFARSGLIRTGNAAATAFPLGPLARVAQLVQPHLDEVERRIAQQAAAFDPDIEGYVTYAVGGRGKRLRPLVALLAGGATGEINSGHVDLAIIVELIHLATLVHDDIMDEAERRRAQPTINARWGNSLSVLLGDCLFAHALDLSTNFENADISRAIARTAREICSGEMIQTQRRFDLKLEVDDYLQIVEKKTGSLFATAAELGATISEADPRAIEMLKTFGLRIGMAYQIYDDCLDIAGTESSTGKTLGTDLRKGKFTLPVLIFLRSASEFERERYCSLILEGKCEEMTVLLKNGATNGALNESIATGSDLIREAQAGMEKFSANAHVEGLFGLCEAFREMLERLQG